MMTLHMSVLEKPIEHRLSRPPTAVYPDRQQIAQFRDEEFPPTATENGRIFDINLEGCFFSPGALKELIVPLGEAVRSGRHGSAAIVVVSSDDGIVEYLEALAERHQLPIFLKPAPNTPLAEARPLGPLTAADIQTYGLIQSAGGEVTSSRVADLAGIEINAAVNRLSTLAKKGYVQRVSRPRRDGDVFVDLLSVAEQGVTTTTDVQQVPTAGLDFSIPEEVRENIQRVAKMQGSDPGEVLLRAWREFVDRHRDVLDTESKEVGRMLKENDREGLAAYANRYNRQRAKQAAARINKR